MGGLTRLGLGLGWAQAAQQPCGLTGLGLGDAATLAMGGLTGLGWAQATQQPSPWEG